MPRYNPPPNWPAPPAGWTPPPGWQPDASWPTPPPEWQVWLPDEATKGKNWFARHKVLAGLGLVVVLVVAASAAGGGNKAKDAADAKPSTVTSVPTTSTSSTSTSPRPAAPKPQIGQPLRDGKFQFTVTRVKAGVAKVGVQYADKKAQGQFVLVYVTVKNIGDKPQALTDSAQYLYNAKGQKAQADTEAALYVNGNGNDVLYNEINPGNAVKGVLVFDVAKNYVPTVIEVHDSLFSGGKKIRLR